MFCRHLPLSLVVVVVSILSATASYAGQAPTSDPTEWTVPRTPWGDPDFQRVWTSDDNFSVPLERPAAVADKVFLDGEELNEAPGQISTTLSDEDRAEIQVLSVTYRQALLACRAEAYADLFATPGGYFGSPVRGEIRERSTLIELVLSYDRCDSPAAAAEAARGLPPPPAAPTIEPAPEGARAQIPYSDRGGYYDDVYVRTPQGWRFKSRNVVSDAEVAIGFTAQDAIEIRQLAGDDHGHYENLYGAEDGPFSPRGIGVTGADTRPFRTAGLRLTVQPDGTATGLAYLRDNGGRYEDVYVKTPDGWRIRERVHVRPGSSQ